MSRLDFPLGDERRGVALAACETAERRLRLLARGTHRRTRCDAIDSAPKCRFERRVVECAAALRCRLSRRVEEPSRVESTAPCEMHGAPGGIDSPEQRARTLQPRIIARQLQ